MRSAMFLSILVVAAAGCEQWKAPERVSALEKKVKQLEDAVTEVTGKPLDDGEKDKDDKDKDDKDHGKKADKGHGKDKTVERKKKSDDEHADEHAKSDEEKAEHDDDKHADKHDADAHADKADDKADEKSDEEKPERIAKADDDAGKKDHDDEKPDASDDKHDTDKHDKADPHDKHDGEPPHWSYFGKTGPSAWGDLASEWSACGTGKQQSPIDISPKKGTAKPITFDYKPSKVSVVDNGHTLQVNFEKGNTIKIGKRDYELVQFHVHTPSEHMIGGERYPMEVHLVHKDEGGKLAVVGVLYDVGPESKALGGVFSQWPKKQGVETKLKKKFDPSSLLPETRTLLRYSGSLTTPPCTEGVVWNVMRRTMTDSNGHMEVFRKHYDSNNARPVQPLNERDVE